MSLRLVRLAIASVFVAAIAPTWADSDLWGHIRFGADILAHGIPARDAYAFTSAATWTNPSWLADALLSLLWSHGGAPALVAAKVLVAAATLGVVAAALHRDRVRGPYAELLTFLCVAALYPSLPVFRPQLFSALLFAVLLLDLTTEGVRPLVAPALFAAWANLHGSWVMGLGALGLFTAVELVAPSRPGERLRRLAAVALAGVATLATPYGVGAWTALAHAMGGPLRDVTEWRGLLETRSPAVVVWALLAALGVAAAATRAVAPSRLAVLVWLAVGAWRVRRVLPFFGVATVMLVAPACAAWSARRPASAAALRPGLRRGLVGAAGLLVGFNLWRAAHAFGCVAIDHEREADVAAARFVRANRLAGRLLTYSDWGLYAVWHFAPALRVSLDGRREFAYPQDELARHDRIYWNAASALDDVAALAPDYVWLPASLPVVPTLVAAGWSPIFATDRSVILAREAAGRWVTPPPRALPPCFPGDPD